MTQSKHTPGPWKWVVARTIQHLHADGGNFAQVSMPAPSEFNEAFMRDAYEANAHLIAAAPELLSALESILFQINQGKVLERDACIAAARTAVSKARGKQ